MSDQSSKYPMSTPKHRFPFVHTLIALLTLAMLVAVVLTWRSYAERRADLKARIERQDNGRIVDGRFSFCGQTLRMDQMQRPYQDERTFAANGLQVHFRRLPSTDADNVVLSVSSLEPFRKSCFDEDVLTPITVFLKCDPPDMPIWNDFRERTWRFRSERPSVGLIAVEGDAEGKLSGLKFIAMPSMVEQRHGLPYQASCYGDPGVQRPVEGCAVAYRMGRVGVDYSFMTRSMRPWREVDEAVRSTLAGNPSTRRCPAPV